MSSSRFYYKPLDAVVAMSIRSNAVRYTARWKGAELHLSVPRGERYEHVVHALEQMTPRLLLSKPTASKSALAVGSRLQLDGDCTISIESSESAGGYLRSKFADSNHLVITVDTDVDISAPDAQLRLSRFMLRAIKIWTDLYVVTRGRELASQLGLKVDEWEVGTGRKTLGRCKLLRKGLMGRTTSRITLSAATMLLPCELRDYIIYHELAHLTHMDHSPEFHALVDRYTGGREARLEARLKAFAWPIVRT